MKGKKRYFKCICDYVEDDILYWTKGKLYEFHKHNDGNCDVKTNLGNWGAVGPDYLLEEIEEYFEIVWQ